MNAVRRPFLLPGRSNYYIDIGRKRRSLGTSDPAEAYKLWNEIRRRLNAEAERPSKLDSAAPITLDAFRRRYLSWSEAVRGPSTYRAERLSLDKLQQYAGGDILIRDLRAHHLEEMTAAEANRALKPSSLNHFIRHLKSIFSRAEVWELVPESPFAKVKLIREKQGPLLRLTKADLPKLFGAIEDPEILRLVKAYLSTGRRRAELTALRWDDVDLAEGKYLIRKAKDNLSRWYPISSVFRQILDETPPDQRFGRVFKYEASTVTHKVKEALRAADLGHLHLHNLRHSFGALYVEAGGDVRTLMELLGHQQISTTLIYSKLSPKHLSKEVDRVDLSEEGA